MQGFGAAGTELSPRRTLWWLVHTSHAVVAHAHVSSHLRAQGLKSSGTRYTLTLALLTRKAAGVPTTQLRVLSKTPEDPEVLSTRLHRFIHQTGVVQRAEHEVQAYTRALSILRKEAELKGRLTEEDVSLAALFIGILQTLAGGHVNQLPVAPGEPIPRPALDGGLTEAAALKLAKIGDLTADFGRTLASKIKREERLEMGRLAEHLASYAGARGSNAFTGVALGFA